MKRFRIATGLMLSAALMAISMGTSVASGHEDARVALEFPAPFCASLGELLVESGGVDPSGREAAVAIEIIGPRASRNPVSMWLPGEPIVTLFTCEGTVTPTLSPDIATAP